MASMYSSCNQTCNTHKNYTANLLCNASTGTCRLAINPSSYSCTAATDPTVSSIYATKGTDLTGGADTDSGSTPGMGSSVSPSPYQSSTYTGSIGTSPEDGEEVPAKEQTALDSARNFIQKQLEERGLNLPSIALAAGLILLLIIVLFSILANMLKGDTTAAPIIVAGKRRREDEPVTVTQPGSTLTQRINSLPPTQSVTTTTVVPSTPPVYGSSVGQQSPQATQPGNTTSMLNRIKDKGIQPPA
jgi:hypothetical protein